MNFYFLLALACWPESLDKFILSSEMFPDWSFLVSWIPLNLFVGPLVVSESSDMSNSTEFLLSELHDHILHSAPISDYLTSDVLIKQYSQDGSFHSSLCHKKSQFFFLLSLSLSLYIYIYIYIYICLSI